MIRFYQMAEEGFAQSPTLGPALLDRAREISLNSGYDISPNPVYS